MKWTKVVLLLLMLLSMCACSGRPETFAADVVYPADLAGYDLFTISEEQDVRYSKEYPISLMNNDEEHDYVCFFLRPVAEEDERPEEIIERLMNSLDKKYTWRNAMYEIRAKNQADDYSDNFEVILTDAQELQVYFRNEPSDYFPCIPLATLRKGESASLIVRTFPFFDYEIAYNEIQKMPEIRYALFAVPCVDPKPGIEIEMELCQVPEVSKAPDELKAGDSIMVYTIFHNTGNIRLNNVRAALQTGEIPGYYAQDSIVSNDQHDNIGLRGGARYQLTEQDIRNQYIEVKVNAWAVPDSIDQDQPIQYKKTEKLWFKDIKDFPSLIQ